MWGKTVFVSSCLLLCVLLFISLPRVLADQDIQFDSDEFEGVENYAEIQKKLKEERKQILKQQKVTEKKVEVKEETQTEKPSSTNDSEEKKPQETKESENKAKSFWLEKDWTIEISFAGILLVYGIVYFLGSKANYKLAKNWITRYENLIRSNFAYFGFGKDRVHKESDFTYSLKTTGRIHCLGSLCTLNLKRRQDLLFYIFSFIFPEKDYITIDIPMTSMPPVSIAILPKNEAAAFKKAQKDMADAKIIPAEMTHIRTRFACLSDTQEVVDILTPNVISILNNNADLLQMLYITDSHPEPYTHKRMLRLKFLLPYPLSKMDELMQLSYSLIDTLANAKLSRHGQIKAESIREKAMKEIMKQTHQLRQEAAERKKFEKEKKKLEKLEKLSPEEVDKYKEKQEKKKLKKKMMKNAKVVVQ